MKIIIISIFTLFLFSCLEGQDGLFGTDGKIGCVETSDCEVGYLCDSGKCVLINNEKIEFTCNPSTNENCNSRDCYLSYSDKKFSTQCLPSETQRTVTVNNLCDNISLFCETGYGCNSTHNCKKICFNDCETPRCSILGKYNNYEIGLCDN